MAVHHFVLVCTIEDQEKSTPYADSQMRPVAFQTEEVIKL